MYNDDVRRTPANVGELWPLLEEHLGFIEEILLHTPLESRKDALDQTYRVGTGKLHNGAMSAIKYRNVSRDYDNRDQFFHLGEALFPVVAKAISSRRITPELLHNWGM